MFGSNEVSVSDLEPRKAPEPMPYIEPPCKPKVPEVSLLINNAPIGNYDKVGNARQLNHSVSEESYNAWKWRQSNTIGNQDKKSTPNFLKQSDVPTDSPWCNTIQQNTIRGCYNDAYAQKPRYIGGKEQHLRHGAQTEAYHVSNFSPSDIGTINTQLYTPIGESTPLQGILRNSGRNTVTYDNMHKLSHKVSYQPHEQPLQVTQGNYAGRKQLTEDSYTSNRNENQAQYSDGNTCSKPSSNSTMTAFRNYTSSTRNMHINKEILQENGILQRSISHRVPTHANQVQTPEYNCCTNGTLENETDEEVNQWQCKLKEKQYPVHTHSLAKGGVGRNQIAPCSCCGSQNAGNFRNIASADTCKNHLNGFSNEEESQCKRVSASCTKPQRCCSASGNNGIKNATEMQAHGYDTKEHGDTKISGNKPPHSNRVKEVMEAQPEILAALFRLVCMQSEQLQQLKDQVQKLVQKLETSAQTTKVHMQNVAVQSESVCSCYQEKVSIGIMVAVEEQPDVQVKAKGSEEHKQLGVVANSCQCCQKSSPAVDETINFNSMKLQTMHESAPSPMSTMHVDMHDYQSDEEQGGVSVRPSQCCGKDGRHKDQQQQAEDGDRIHWTFYSNVMQQMNKLMDTSEKSPANNTAEDSQKKIQMATFKELVHMGVSICDAASAVGDQSLLFDSRLNMMAMNAEVGDSGPKTKINPEAVKYLDEQLRQTDKNGAGNKVDLTLFLKTSNLSFTALRYLQQNHGLPLFTEPSKGAQLQRNPVAHDSNPRHHHCCYSHDAPPSKVLDITMLKQQPKLL